MTKKLEKLNEAERIARNEQPRTDDIKDESLTAIFARIWYLIGRVEANIETLEHDI